VDIRRIEGGIFNWGAENPYENNPYEIGLDRSVDLDVDCVARDALRLVAEQGVTRRIVGVVESALGHARPRSSRCPSSTQRRRSRCHNPRCPRWLAAPI